MNIILEPKKPNKEYIGNIDKTFTIGELKELLGGYCEMLYLPKNNTYIVFRKLDKYAKAKEIYNAEATGFIRDNYDKSNTVVYGKALITDNI
tara:strand:- start:204 stop:479 length:276 start_codon:yes stop_codon:yes gene_type:complete